MSVLEICLYQRDVCIREMTVLEMFVLERCLYKRETCIREMFVLERNVCALERSLFQRGT